LNDLNYLQVDIVTLQAAYANGDVTPTDIVDLFVKLRVPALYGTVWISQFTPDQLKARAAELELLSPAERAKRSLYGVLVAVKDNIDVRGLATTAACPAFSYLPSESALVVQLLEKAGAIIVGKTNLDQFATGLVGTRSPYGEVPNSFNPDYISGGSSSGSAVALAMGQVHLALATDTAGSGRVPAALNNLVGLKPSVGVISNNGLVPACRSLDCISILARTVADAALAFDVMVATSVCAHAIHAVQYEKKSLRIAVPSVEYLNFFGDEQARECFETSIQTLKDIGAVIEEINFSVFINAAKFLYDGPFVVERLEAAGDLIRFSPSEVHPVVSKVISKAEGYTALQVIKAQGKIMRLRDEAAALLANFDALVVPTIPTAYTRSAVNADPIELNSRLGTYTNGVNLLRLCALAVPTGFREDGIPAGITLIAPNLHDLRLAHIGKAIQDQLRLPLGATSQPYPEHQATSIPKAPTIQVAVVGAHLSGMPLNWQLTERKASLVATTLTSPDYRLYHLKDTVPPKPGLMRVLENGASIVVEVWEMPLSDFGSFVGLIPSPLGIGTITLADGTSVKSFICEAYGIEGAKDITEFGGWRSYIASL
jgi:allophanate hydrolase